MEKVLFRQYWNETYRIRMNGLKCRLLGSCVSFRLKTTSKKQVNSLNKAKNHVMHCVIGARNFVFVKKVNLTKGIKSIELSDCCRLFDENKKQRKLLFPTYSRDVLWNIKIHEFILEWFAVDSLVAILLKIVQNITIWKISSYEMFFMRISQPLHNVLFWIFANYYERFAIPFASERFLMFAGTRWHIKSQILSG